jgi:hypothetical protein
MSDETERNRPNRTSGLQFLANQHPAVITTRVLHHIAPEEEETETDTPKPPPATKLPAWPDPSYLVGLWRRLMGNLWVRQSDSR